MIDDGTYRNRQKSDTQNANAEYKPSSEGDSPVKSFMHLLRTPIAKRKGLTLSKEDCEVWAEEFEKWLKK